MIPNYVLKDTLDARFVEKRGGYILSGLMEFTGYGRSEIFERIITIITISNNVSNSEKNKAKRWDPLRNESGLE